MEFITNLLLIGVIWGLAHISRQLGEISTKLGGPKP
jgi:hypothetical protein